MIPTYNCGDYLRRTLDSVLRQDEGTERMQIEVVDGCSTKDDPEAVVKALGKGRVAYHRLSENRGGPNTFNECIRRSRGHWIHILHGDDTVNPHFYKTYRSAIDSYCNPSLVYSRYREIDESDQVIGTSRDMRSPQASFVVAEFMQKQASVNQCGFPTVAVRRAAYEHAGGFCTMFQHVTDMDMWFRASLTGSVVFVNETAANYRIHRNQHSSECVRSARNIFETSLLIQVNLMRLSSRGYDVAPLRKKWRKELARYAAAFAYRFDDSGDLQARVRYALWSFRLNPCLREAAFCAKSMLKQRWSAQICRRSMPLPEIR
jgi:glycosyltransferase involved in cell wall biosynthesis